MSNYYEDAWHPVKKTIEKAEWLDDYFGKHQYGVRFLDGQIFKADECIVVDTSPERNGHEND